LLNLIRSILGGLGGGAAKKVIDEVSKDGDPTNEIRNVGNSANKFAEGFSRTEQQLVQSLVKKLGLENKGVTFWRGEGAPEAYRASAATDKPYITIFDGFFKLSRQQQLKALREEWNHLQQNINELSDDLIWYYEQQAKRGR
jgi:cell division protein FtsB